MARPIGLQIEVSTPCHEDWGKMRPCSAGRHCGQCQKTVIDFSTWSDADLYRFFAQHNESVCGRFHNGQLNRLIKLPPQPHSGLYRMVVALGLTLIFVQGSRVYAQGNMPKTTHTKTAQWPPMPPLSMGKISGTVLDEKKRPVFGATVTLFRKGINMGGALTNVDGRFDFINLFSGKYTVWVQYTGYNNWAEDIDINNGAYAIAPVELHRKQIRAEQNLQITSGIVTPTIKYTH